MPRRYRELDHYGKRMNEAFQERDKGTLALLRYFIGAVFVDTTCSFGVTESIWRRVQQVESLFRSDIFILRLSILHGVITGNIELRVLSAAIFHPSNGFPLSGLSALRHRGWSHVRQQPRGNGCRPRTSSWSLSGSFPTGRL